VTGATGKPERDDTRQEARIQAFGALYAADVLKLEAVDIDRLSSRAVRLATGTWHHREAIDAAISSAATTWRIERMPAIDRTILRLGTYELWHTPQPKAVVISEAVGIAKRYSTAKSGAFVNGVLSTLADHESQVSDL
jgi:N utilization substance protein B